MVKRYFWKDVFLIGERYNVITSMNLMTSHFLFKLQLSHSSQVSMSPVELLLIFHYISTILLVLIAFLVSLYCYRCFNKLLKHNQ